MGGERSIEQASTGEVVLYEAPDGGVRVDVRLVNDPVWLTQAQMAELVERRVPPVEAAKARPRTSQ